MTFGTFQGWVELGVLALGALALGILAARRRWARWTGIAAAALLAVGLVIIGVLVWNSEGTDRLIGQAAFLVLFLPAGGGLCLLYGLGFLLGRAFGGGPRAGAGTRP